MGGDGGGAEGWSNPLREDEETEEECGEIGEKLGGKTRETGERGQGGGLGNGIAAVQTGINNRK